MTPEAPSLARMIVSLRIVMPAHSRPKDGVASLAYVSAIHALLCCAKGVDARHKAGHDVVLEHQFTPDPN